MEVIRNSLLQQQMADFAAHLVAAHLGAALLTAREPALASGFDLRSCFHDDGLHGRGRGGDCGNDKAWTERHAPAGVM